MTRQTLRDRNQHVIGYIDVEFSGRQVLRDSNNHVLGYYEPGRNQTATRRLTPTTMSLEMATSSPLSCKWSKSLVMKNG